MGKSAQKTESNSYFTHMGIDSPAEASILANEYAWSIIEIVQLTGSRGITAEEVQSKIEEKEGIKISRSKTYALLRRLYEMQFLHKHYDTYKNAQVYTQSGVVGQIDLDPEFLVDVEDKMEIVITKKLFPAFQEYVEKTIEELDSDEATRHWLPYTGKYSLCERCHINHEAEEFVDALISSASFLFLRSNGFVKFAKNKKFADEKYEIKN